MHTSRLIYYIAHKQTKTEQEMEGRVASCRDEADLSAFSTNKSSRSNAGVNLIPEFHTTVLHKVASYGIPHEGCR